MPTKRRSASESASRQAIPRSAPSNSVSFCENGCPGADTNSVCAIHKSSCFSRCLRVPIAMRRFYEQTLWIPQNFPPTNPDLHHGLLRHKAQGLGGWGCFLNHKLVYRHTYISDVLIRSKSKSTRRLRSMQPKASSRWFSVLVPVRAIRERLREMLTLRPQSVFPLTLVAALLVVIALPAYTQTTPESTGTQSTSDVNSTQPAVQPAQPPTTVQKAPRKSANKPANAELQALKDAVAAQQEQIKALSQHLQQTNQQLQQTNQQFQETQQQLQQATADAANKAAAAQAQASQEQQSVGELKGDVADLKTSATNAALSLQETQKTVKTGLENPLSLRFKGVTLTPGGYLDATFIRRSRALAEDAATPLNSVQMPGAAQGTMAEFFGSGRQSRISLLTEGKLNNVKLRLRGSGLSLSRRDLHQQLHQRLHAAPAPGLEPGRVRQRLELHRRATVESHRDRAWSGKPQRSGAADHRQRI